MKLYFVAGERSGDLHGGNLIRALRQARPSIICRGFGGEAMQQAGMEVVVHYRHLAFMGFAEVLRHLGRICAHLKHCQADLLAFKPHAVVLIDFAGFNLRIARFAKQQGIKVVWYIAPKVWAWNSRRALKLKALVDCMLVILPFEPPFFKRFGWQVHYVGNPVLEAVQGFTAHETFLEQHNLPAGRLVALLPGSRRQELKHMAPVLARVARRFPDLVFAVPAVDNLRHEDYYRLRREPNIRVLQVPAYPLLAFARAAVVTSGTATLETALFNVPQVVVYRTSWFSYLLGRALIRVPFISLVNLIAGRRVVPELIQGQARAARIAAELQRLLHDPACRSQVQAGYAQVREQLGPAVASQRAAAVMLNFLENSARPEGEG
jgi:lipid-A-disaccharide synthase